MACSATKSQAGGKMPLFDIYTGPLWQSLKTHIGAIPTSNVFVLSGKFGFQSATLFEAETYEGRLGPVQAETLIHQGVNTPTDYTNASKRRPPMGPSPLNWLGWGASRKYRAVIICASTQYREVFEAWLPQLIASDAIAADAAIHQTEGGIGVQRAQMRSFLALYQTVVTPTTFTSKRPDAAAIDAATNFVMRMILKHTRSRRAPAPSNPGQLDLFGQQLAA